jgi:hypothetical protein
MQTKIAATQPCLNPFENNKGPNATFWIGELTKQYTGWTGCTPQQLSANTSIAVDSRYKIIPGLNVTDYDLQLASGVLAMTSARKHYTVGVFPGISAKKNVVMNAYARPIIGWNLTCELTMNMSRATAFNLYSQRVTTAGLQGYSSLGYSVTSLIVILSMPV